MLQDAIRFFLFRDNSGRLFNYRRHEVFFLYLIGIVVPSLPIDGLGLDLMDLARCTELVSMISMASMKMGIPAASGSQATAMCKTGEFVWVAGTQMAATLLYYRLMPWMLATCLKNRPGWNPDVSIRNALLSASLICMCIMFMADLLAMVLNYPPASEVLDPWPLLLFPDVVLLIGMWKILRHVGAWQAALTLLGCELMAVILAWAIVVATIALMVVGGLFVVSLIGR
jgi:hypothetical protein